MIPLVLAMFLVGSHAQLSSLLGSVAKTVQAKELGVVTSLNNGVNNGVTSVVTIVNSTKDGTVIETVAGEVKKEAGAVTQPVESVVLLTATNQCELLKELLGVDYYSKSLLKEEDLNKLTLEFITPDLYFDCSVRVIYNLSDAAELIPAARGFNPNLTLIIFAHGFLSNPDSDTVRTIINSFHEKGEYNVLALDSSAYIEWFYLRSSTYVRYIGERLGRVLAAMVQHSVTPESIHLIGHSLGAHICGFTGKEFTRLTGLRVGRITGLDAAGPCFYNADSDMKLNATDADYVDVIHTTDGSFGVTAPAGVSDFYVNGGAQQPGCVEEVCGHQRVWEIFAESILNLQAFIAVKCTSWDQFRANKCGDEKVIMGYGTTSDAKGLYFLRTASSSPYGLGEEGTTYVYDEGVLKSTQPLGPDSIFA